MSPLWRDQLRIFLYPDKVTIVRVRKGLRPKEESRQSIPCEPVAELAPWFAPLNTLMQWLGETKPQKTDVTVILSNHFVRYCLLPWSAEIGSAEEEMVFARIHFEKIFGDVVSQWSLRVSDAPYQSSRLASAVDQELLTGLAEVFEKSEVRLVSIQPYLMWCMNDCCLPLKNQKGLFLLVEQGKACLMRFDEKAVVDIKAIVLQEDVLEELTALLQREMLFYGLDERTSIYVHATEFGMQPLEEKVAARFHHLSEPNNFVSLRKMDVALGDTLTRVA